MNNFLQVVRIAFISKGTSLTKWCSIHGIDRSFAAKSLTGIYSFPSAIALRSRILAAAGINELGQIENPLEEIARLKQRIRDLEALLTIARFPARSTPACPHAKEAQA